MARKISITKEMIQKDFSLITNGIRKMKEKIYENEEKEKEEKQ